MLRREFIKSTSLTLGGILIAGHVALGRPEKENFNRTIARAKIYRLRGHARSGCATPPHYLETIEYGLSSTFS